jgi:hypothetical protein
MGAKDGSSLASHDVKLDPNIVGGLSRNLNDDEHSVPHRPAVKPAPSVTHSHVQAGDSCPVCSEIAGRVTGAPCAPVRGRHRGGILGVAVILLAAATVTVIAWPRGDTPSPTRTPELSAVDPMAAQATSWAGLNLAPHVSILTDPTTAPTLIKAGFDAVTSPASAQLDYVFSTSRLRAQPAAANSISSAVPIAQFGPVSSGITIEALVSDPPPDLATVRAADLQNRRQAGIELLANSALTVADGAASTLRAGGLDMRAATVLAFLANGGAVSVLSITVNPPEQAVDLPARVVDLSPSDPGAASAILAALPPSYRPVSVALTSSRLRLTWPVNPLPTAVLH